MWQTLLFVMAFVLVAFNAGAAEYKSVASGVRYTHMGDYSVERLNTILSTEVAAFSSFKIQYPQAANGVSLYKVQYSTVIPEQGNKPTLASGLVAVPQTAQKKRRKGQNGPAALWYDRLAVLAAATPRNRRCPVLWHRGACRR